MRRRNKVEAWAGEGGDYFAHGHPSPDAFFAACQAHDRACFGTPIRGLYDEPGPVPHGVYDPEYDGCGLTPPAEDDLERIWNDDRLSDQDERWHAVHKPALRYRIAALLGIPARVRPYTLWWR